MTKVTYINWVLCITVAQYYMSSVSFHVTRGGTGMQVETIISIMPKCHWISDYISEGAKGNKSSYFARCCQLSLSSVGYLASLLWHLDILMSQVIDTVKGIKEI